jgi:hypothetical protein
VCTANFGERQKEALWVAGEAEQGRLEGVLAWRESWPRTSKHIHGDSLSIRYTNHVAEIYKGGGLSRQFNIIQILSHEFCHLVQPLLDKLGMIHESNSYISLPLLAKAISRCNKYARLF